MSWETVDELQALVRRFEASAIASGEWTHRAHVAVASWYVHHFGASAALEKMRAGILALNAQHGTPNTDTHGYHETITRAYVALIAQALRGSAGDDAARAVHRVLEGPVARPGVLLRYYSEARLMSVEARRDWMVPDLRPFNDVIVRVLVPADAPAYRRLRIAAQQEHPEFVGLNAERELADGDDCLEAMLATYPREGTVVWGAFVDEALAGVAALTRRDSRKYRHKAFLWGMYVYPQQRGRGVAQSLMTSVLDWARAQDGLLALTLQVTASNEGARAWYERLGFETFGTERDSLYAAGRFHDAHYMELRLD